MSEKAKALKNRNSSAGSILKKYSMVIALVVVFVFFTLLTEGRLILPQNLSNLLLQNAYVLVLGCGMLLCILTGGNVDLSIGSTVCLIGALATQMLANTGLPAILIIVISIAIAGVIGIAQGWLIGYVHIPPFICTLAGMFLFRGLGRVVLDSKTIPIQNQLYLDIFTRYINIPGIDTEDLKVSAIIFGVLAAIIVTAGTILGRIKKRKNGYAMENGTLAYIRVALIDALIVVYSIQLANYKGISVMLLWIIALILIYAYITSKTAFGRTFYAVGGNEKATKLSGIDPRRVYFSAYLSMSLMAGLSGLLVAARIGSVNGDSGSSYEMDAIGSCFIGGASAYGGSGSVVGIVIGAILLGTINQGMSIYGLDNNWQYVVKGVVLLLAVVFDVVSNNKTGKS